MRRSGFAKGILIGSMIGASVGMAINSDIMNSRTRKRMKRKGMEFMRKSGTVIGDVMDWLR